MKGNRSKIADRVEVKGRKLRKYMCSTLLRTFVKKRRMGNNLRDAGALSVFSEERNIELIPKERERIKALAKGNNS